MQTAELLLDHSREISVVFRRCAFQIKRVNCRLRKTCVFDLIINPFQLPGISAKQDHRRAVAGKTERYGATDAVAGPGNQNDAVF